MSTQLVVVRADLDARLDVIYGARLHVASISRALIVHTVHVLSMYTAGVSGVRARLLRDACLGRPPRPYLLLKRTYHLGTFLVHY